jgi:hypothetical protein
MPYEITKHEAKELDVAELEKRLSELMLELECERMESRRSSMTIRSIDTVRSELARRKRERLEKSPPLENIYL